MIPKIKKVTCVGSGLVGQGWATVFALAGYQVILEDVSDEKVGEAQKRVEKQMLFLEEKKIANNSKEAIKRVSVTTSLVKALEDTDFVQESVYESYPVKKEIFKKMDEATDKHVILSSSSSGLMMSEIAKAALNHPERCIVAHPYNPSYLVPLVEISPGTKTSVKTIKMTRELMEDIGKVPVTLLKEAPGFIANRLSAALWREALNLVDKGITSAEDVDKAIVNGPGLRWSIMGPYLTYHLGGGKGGIEYLMRHIDVSKAKWLETMATWTETPETAVEKAVKGVYEMPIVKEHSIDELEEWRDNKLVDILKITKKSGK